MIWIVGNKGMLGTELSQLLTQSGISSIGTDREADITNLSMIVEFAGGLENIDWIVNCAAYTAVDKAEDDIETCHLLNVLGAANIAVCAKKNNARLIHVSTDYVFNGKGTRPYREDDPTNPIGMYGLTKRDGELAVIENNNCSVIIRTAWLYGKYGNNFVNTMVRLMNERDEIKVVDDQRGSPTWAHDLAAVIMAIFKKDIPYGIYHCTNEGNITWFDFAKEIFRQGRELGLIKKNCRITACTSAEYPAKVKRPAYSVLDKSKIMAALQIDIPSWKASLKEYLTTCVV